MLSNIFKQFIEDISKIHIDGSVSLTILNFAHQIEVEIVDGQSIYEDIAAVVLEIIQLELQAIQGTNEQTSNLKEACSLVYEFITNETGDQQELISQLADIKVRYQ